MIQKTIKNPSVISGSGLHTGRVVNLRFLPADENSGVVFRRVDLEGQPTVLADVDNVTDTSRGTTIEKNGAKVMTIEHCLSAVFALDIDNIIVEIDAEETPILDGSAKLYVEALTKSGVVEQKAERIVYNLDAPISFKDEARGCEFFAIPDTSIRFSTLIDYKTKVLNTQYATLDNLADFKKEIANCRTFVFLEEMMPLIENNLIRGGDFSNAIVFVNNIPSQDEIDKLSKFFNKPKVEILEQGILNNCSLNFENEPARHKLLDLIGDLSLVGMHFNAKIFATHPGHEMNIKFAKEIKKGLKKQIKASKIPHFTPDQTPIYDVNAIRKMMPHRYPFQLVDKIMEISENHIVGVKNVTSNEPFFQGHFPEEPVMPGVLQVESLAQCGGVLVLSQVKDPELYSTYFMKIENVRFRRKVVPGDTLVFRLELISPIRRGLVHMAGTVYVGDTIVTEAEMLAQVAKTK